MQRSAQNYQTLYGVYPDILFIEMLASTNDQKPNAHGNSSARDVNPDLYIAGMLRSSWKRLPDASFTTADSARSFRIAESPGDNLV